MADEHSTGVHLTKAEALERLTELRDQALTAAEHAGPADPGQLGDHDVYIAKAHCYRLAMGIVRNIHAHCDSCDGYNCNPYG